MRNTTKAFRRALAEGRRDYVLKAVITLIDNTTLQVTNEQIWDGGFSIEDAVSNDNVFQVGSAIINQARLTINNIYDTFSTYDFNKAKVVMYVGLTGLDDGTNEWIKMGTYFVDETEYNGSIIALTCLDAMYRFDQAYNGHIIYPATLGDIVRDACTKCGVTLATNSLQFPHYNYIVEEAPSSSDTTYRQVLAWAVQIAGCFARINADGQLEIKWYNIDVLNSVSQTIDGGVFDSGTPYYTTGDSVDGGTFNPWNTGGVADGGTFTDSDISACHYIPSSFSSQISTDDVVITGVKVVKRIKSDDSSDSYVEYMSGDPGYVVSIEGNDLIQGMHGQDIADWIAASIVYSVGNPFKFRKASITHPNDPTIEAGDVALFWDYKGNCYNLVVSSTTFVADSSQNTMSSAETPLKNSAQRFTETTRNYVELRDQLARQRTRFEEALDDLSDRLDEAGGLYATYVTEQGATKTYYHDKPNLSDSSIVMLFSDVGFTLTSNYQDDSPTWYGMTVDGTMIAGIMNTIGINFDWGVGGELVIMDQNNHETFYANAETGVVRIKATQFSLSDGSTIESIAQGVAAGYGTCSTGSATQNKVVSLSGFSLFTGARISVYFTYGNSASNPTLNVNGTGAKPISIYGAYITSANSYCNWINNSTVDFIYDGTYWRMIDNASLSKVHTLDASLDQQSVFNRLTNNSQQQGIYLNNGKLYLNFTYAVGQTLKLGGSSNSYGKLSFYDNNNTLVGGWDRYGITIDNSEDAYSITLRDGLMKFYEYNGAIANSMGALGITYIDVEEDWGFYDDVFAIEGSRVLIRNSYYNKGIRVDSNGLYVKGNLSVTGTKPRLVEDTNYGDRFLYAYETPTPYFGDIGTGKTDETGTAIIDIDDIFDETVNVNIEYCVFLQKEGQGDLWVDEKDHSFFVVKGTPNLKFSWELKAVQRGFETLRLEDDAITRADNLEGSFDIDQILEDDLKAFDKEMEELEHEDFESISGN